MYLFRVKVQEEAQRRLFSSSQSRSNFTLGLIGGKPHAENRRGYTWHIGNVQMVGAHDVIFAVGRTTKTSREQYDEESGDFLEVEDEEAPFTFAYFESQLGVLGILPKSRLAPTVRGIARNLGAMLNDQPEVQREGLRIEISELWDPEGFLQQVHEAFAVVGFTIEFGHPNPWDVEEDFHRPLERYLQQADGAKGRTTVQGEDLDRDTIEKVVRSIASVGNDASARLRNRRGHPPVVRRLRGDPVQVSLDEDHIERPASVFEAIRRAYGQLRSRGDDQ